MLPLIPKDTVHKIRIRRGYSGVVARPIDFDQWDARFAVFFQKTGLYLDKF